MERNGIRFKRDGRVIEAYVISRDADPTCAIWAVDAGDPDRDYMVRMDEVIGFWTVSYDRNGRPVRAFVPAK